MRSDAHYAKIFMHTYESRIKKKGDFIGRKSLINSFYVFTFDPDDLMTRISRTPVQLLMVVRLRDLTSGRFLF